MSAAFIWDDNVRAAAQRLRPLASNVRTKRLHWIHTPQGTYIGAHGFCWCPECGDAKVRHLRKRAKRKDRQDYFLDGGFGSEEDGPEFCCGCGIRLRCTLTSHGVQEVLWHFETYGPRGGSADDAYEILACLEAVECRSADDKEAAELAVSAVKLAEALLTPAVAP